MRRACKIALVVVAVLTVCGLLFRYVILDKWIDARLERLHQVTGIRATYETVDLSFQSLTVQNIALFWDKETAPSAKTDKVVFDFVDSTLRWTDLRVERKGLRAVLRGAASLSQNTLDIKGSLPPVSCASLLDAMPEAVRSRLGGVRLDGSIAADLHFRLSEEHPKKNRLNIALDNGCTVTDFGALPKPDLFKQSFVQRALDRNKKPYDRTVGPGSDSWVEFQDISPFMRDAVLEAEDPLFYKHNGIMPSRIATAARINLRDGVFRYGASTLSMQTAKNLFLSREKTLERKLMELFFVWYLESNFTKDEIFTLYLNVAEMGPSVYGVKAAAQHYFGTLPRDLTLRQAAFLAKLLPSPVSRSRARELGEVPKADARRIRALLREMQKSERITEAEHDEALSQKISFENGGKTPTTAIAESQPEIDAAEAQAHVRRISRPRLKQMPPPFSKLLSGRRPRGADLDRKAFQSSQ